MKALECVIWLRDEAGVIRHSKEGGKMGKPSNGELRRWIKNGCVEVNGRLLALTDEVPWPLESLVLFPSNKHARCTIR